MVKNILLTIFRNIRKNKLYFFFDILSLVIGLTFSILILLYLNYETSYDRFHEQHANIWRISTDYGMDKSAASSPPLAPVLKKEIPGITNAVRLLKTNPLITYIDARFQGENYYYAGPEFFDVFSFQLLQGDKNSALKEPNSILLTQSMADKLFAGESPINQIVEMNNGRKSLKVTGILADPPTNSHFSFAGIISWATLEASPANQDFLNDWWSLEPYTYILVRDNFDPAQVEQRWPELYHKYISTDTAIALRPIVQPLNSIHLNSQLRSEHRENGKKSNLYIMGIILVFMILMSSINYMNMATSRSSQRAKEIGVRKVLGAYRGQLRFQFILESLSMTVISLLLSVGLAWLLLPTFSMLLDADLSFSSLFAPKLLLVVAGITLLIGIGAGIYPAFFLSSFNPITALKGGSTEKRSNFFLRKLLIVLQFSIAFVMLTGILLVNRQINFMLGHDVGFNKNNILGVNLKESKIRGKSELLKQEFRSNPVITGACGVQSYPGAGDHLIPKMVINYQNDTRYEEQSMVSFVVDYEFIPTLEIKLTHGRNFEKGNMSDVREGVIINEAAMRSFGWTGEPIGKKILTNPGAPDSLKNYLKVIGVVADFHIKSLHDVVEPMMLTTMDPSEPVTTILLKYTDGSERSAKAHAENVMLDQSPAYPFDAFELESVFNELYRSDSNFAGLLFYLACTVIFISCIGLFGLSSYTAEKRRKEVCIRKILGAEQRELILLLLKDFLILVTIAVVIASPAAYLTVDNWLSNFAFATGISFWYFVISALILYLISVSTTIYHILKVMQVKPAITLKAE